VKLETGNI